MAAVVALIAFVLMNRHGSFLDSDGWAYWQGSFSLLEGKGYRYFSGHPIVAWPPLYSLYLAVWMLLLGPTGLALAIANGVLIVAQALLWFRLSRDLAGRSARDSLWVEAAVASYVGMFVAAYQPGTIAHNLFYLLLPLQIVTIWYAARHERVRRAFRYAVLNIIVSSLCVLCHNSGILFVIAGCLAFLSFGETPLPLRAVLAFLMFAFPIAIWESARVLLRQQRAHPIGSMLFHESIGLRTDQMLNGIKQMIVPHATPLWLTTILLAAAATFVWRRTGGPRALAFSFMYICVSLGCLLSVFVLTRINDGLEGRFVLFVPLLLVPLLFRELSRAKAFGPLAIAVALTIPLLVARSVKWMVFLPRPPAVHQGTVGVGLVPLGAELSRLPKTGSSLVVGGRLLVGPFPYEEPDEARQPDQ